MRVCMQIFSITRVELTSEGADIYLYGEDGSGQLMIEGVRAGYASIDHF